MPDRAMQVDTQRMHGVEIGHHRVTEAGDVRPRVHAAERLGRQARIVWREFKTRY